MTYIVFLYFILFLALFPSSHTIHTPNTYRISIAKNGREGLETTPDIVISDVMMPEMDGFTLLSHLKEDFRTSHIPVVLLTAKADVASRLSGLSRGAYA